MISTQHRESTITVHGGYCSSFELKEPTRLFASAALKEKKSRSRNRVGPTQL